MAGEWIKVENTTPEKAEVYAIAERLGLEPDAVIGKLLRVWIWFDEHLETGNARIVTKMLVDRIAAAPGFAEAMLGVRWLNEKNGQFSIPHFERHNGKTAKSRALTAKRVAKHKANAKVTLNALPREEKRRSNTPIPPSGAFLRFWGAWPKHVRKRSQGVCWERWRKLDLDQHAEQIHAHVEAMKLSLDWRKESGRYIPAPEVYLNKRHWEGAELDAAAAPSESPLYSRQGPM